MNDRQRFAYEHPLWVRHPWALEPEYRQRLRLNGLIICTFVTMHGSDHGTRPEWRSSVGPMKDDGNYIRLDTLSDEQLEVLRSLAMDLLREVGIEPYRVIQSERSFEVSKDLSDGELAGLPLELREARPAIRKVSVQV